MECRPVAHNCRGGSTDNRGSLGIEWIPGLNIALRGGLYSDGGEIPFINACGIGVGWAYLFLEADASYVGSPTSPTGRVLSASRRLIPRE